MCSDVGMISEMMRRVLDELKEIIHRRERSGTLPWLIMGVAAAIQMGQESNVSQSSWLCNMTMTEDITKKTMIMREVNLR